MAIPFTMAGNMRTVVFQPDRDGVEAVSIIQTTRHHVDGDFEDFYTPEEAAAYLAAFLADCVVRPRVLGAYTRAAIAAIG